MVNQPSSDGQPQLTICIPVHPAHTGLLMRAVESCKAQTIPVLWGVWEDKPMRGPGFARNRMIEKVSTPYVTFLDADDWLEPTFADRMLAAIATAEKQNLYVYCGWIEDFATGPVNVEAPARCFCQFEDTDRRDAHLITSILPIGWARQIGGFDENLPGMEDTDFWFKLRANGHCGERINEFLVHYTDGGMRSDQFRQRPDRAAVKQLIQDRYRGSQIMSCCNDAPAKNPEPSGDREPGDVTAVSLGTSAFTYVGIITRRVYRNVPGYGSLMWIDPRDAEADPRRFRPMIAPPPPVIRSAADVGNAMNAHIRDGADVFLPQNEQTVAPRGRLSAAQLRKMAGFDK